MDNFITINDQVIYEGTTLSLVSYPDSIWLLKNGPYSDGVTVKSGWYLVNVRNGEALEYTKELDIQIDVVSYQQYENAVVGPYPISEISNTDDNKPCHHNRPPCPDTYKYPFDITSVVVVGRSPYINEDTKTWMIWNNETKQYEDSGVRAEVSDEDIQKAIDQLNSSVSASPATGNVYSVLTGVTQTKGKLTDRSEVTLSSVAKTGNLRDINQSDGDTLILYCGTSDLVI